MARRKGIYIYIPKYLMAVRNCVPGKYFCYLRVTVEVSPLLTCSYIGELRNGRKIKCENRPFIVFIFIFRRVLYSICLKKTQLNLQPLG